MGKRQAKPKKRRTKKGNDIRSGTGPKNRTLMILLTAGVAAIAAICFYALYAASPHFVVGDVIIQGGERPSQVNYADLKRMAEGKNIFTVNLSEARRYMLENYGELRDLRLERAFPGAIIATAVLRDPVAQLYRDKYYPIDKDGVILSGAAVHPLDTLPIINGVSFNPTQDVGKPAKSRRAANALQLLSELTASGILDDHRLVEIDVSMIGNIIFFLEDGLEVKIGRTRYAQRLESLRKILSDPKMEPAGIRYIDLRFKDPVIGPKWKN